MFGHLFVTSMVLLIKMEGKYMVYHFFFNSQQRLAEIFAVVQQRANRGIPLNSN